MDFSHFTDDRLTEEIEAMRLALNAPLGNPFDGGEARLRQKLQAAEKEWASRNPTGAKGKKRPAT